MVRGPPVAILSWALQMLGAGMLKAVLGDCLSEMKTKVSQSITHINYSERYSSVFHEKGL